MTELDHIESGDVSCRAFTYYRVCEGEGLIDLDEILEGFPYSREFMEDPDHRISWNHWADLAERVGDALNHDPVVIDNTADLKKLSGLTGPLGRIVGTIVDVERVYIAAYRWIAPSLYRNLLFNVDSIGERRIRVSIEIPETYRGTRTWLQMSAGVMRILPGFIDLDDSVVDVTELTEHKLTTEITLPHKHSLIERLRRSIGAAFTSHRLLAQFETQQHELATSYRRLQDVERNVRETLDALPVGVALHSHGQVLYANHVLREWLGEQNNLIELIAPEFRTTAEPLFDVEIEGQMIELEFVADDRRVNILAEACHGVLYEDSKASVFSAIDVTERRLAQAKLAKSMKTQQILSETLPDLLIRVSSDGVFLDFMGKPSVYIDENGLRALVGQKVRAIETSLGASFKKPIDTILRVLDTGRAEVVDFELSQSWIEARVLCFEGEVVALLRDVTKRRMLEHRVALSERMASLGTLAAGVAHEINNPLTYIIGNLSMVLDNTKPELVTELVEEALDGAERVRDIVAELKGFSRPDTHTFEVVDLAMVLEKAAGLASNEVRHRAAVEFDCQDGLPPVFGSERQLVQVITNLVVNSAQAIEEAGIIGGKIRLSTRADGFDRPMAIVEDNGPGMSREVQRRIFDPFFTTKVAEGTGLGLAIVHQLVDDMGGDIHLSSEVGKGTRFAITLPPLETYDDSPLTAELSEISEIIDALQGRILVVDDEPFVRRMIERSLEGVDVTTVDRAESAFEAMHASHFDVILCDLMMPGETGMQLYQRLVDEGSDVPPRMIFMTGGTFTDEADRFLKTIENPVIFKPFSMNELKKTVFKAFKAEAINAS